MTFYLKQNDTSPALMRQMLNAAGDPINLTGATAVFNMASIFGVMTCSAKPAVIFTGTLPAELGGATVTAADGWLRYNWDAADTDTAGIFAAEFQVTYAGGAIETAPNGSHETVVITPEISAANYPVT